MDKEYRRTNGYSTENYKLMDEESPKERLLCWELPAQGLGIHRRNGIALEITSS
jgi:hypothetical protein